MRKIFFALLLGLAAAGCAKPQENNSFAERQVYSTEAFSFEVPTPWFYAIPDATKTKNVARCFLHLSWPSVKWNRGEWANVVRTG